jgi:hypothetical protein
VSEKSWKAPEESGAEADIADRDVRVLPVTHL